MFPVALPFSWQGVAALVDSRRAAVDLRSFVGVSDLHAWRIRIKRAHVVDIALRSNALLILVGCVDDVL